MAGSHIRSVVDLFGPAGRLEALLNSGLDDAPYCALVCHPHPAGGGTMHNKVVYHAMKVFASFGLPVLRFNFRGTGLSEGAHDDGNGEQEDVRAALDWLDRAFAKPILVAGFSFGAYVSLRSCCGDPRIHGLVSLGLPIAAEGRSYEYSFLSRCTTPKLFLSGDHDEFGPRNAVTAAWNLAPEPKRCIWIEGADHFFQGTKDSPGPKLARMQEEMRLWLQESFALKQS
jgi:alpha/beta superfamily hydrolase